MEASSYLQMTTKSEKGIPRKNGFNITISRCNCLQSCTYLQYKTERSQTHIDRRKFYETVGKMLNRSRIPESHYSEVWIYFKEAKFIPVRRMEVYGKLTLIANWGGLLSLCLGTSLLSFVELFYWLLVRPCWRSRRVTPAPPSRTPRLFAPPHPKLSVYSLTERHRTSY